LTCQFSMLQSCSILNMILIMHLNFFTFFLFWFIKISIARWSLLNNSCTLCSNLKKYEIISHDLEDPRVTNKLPSLIHWCVCLQKCISKFNDALFKVKLLSWWIEGCNTCKVDLDHNIMTQQASNNEMWVAKRSNIGPRGKPTIIL
jgi:hypothetical protein